MNWEIILHNEKYGSGQWITCQNEIHVSFRSTFTWTMSYKTILVLPITWNLKKNCVFPVICFYIIWKFKILCSGKHRNCFTWHSPCESGLDSSSRSFKKVCYFSTKSWQILAKSISVISVDTSTGDHPNYGI